ncbi:hypothetical protein [Streptomyces nigra]|uniref:hypothetical protein n=1 Tax=Streptomyces nigra TaxID=1827580 RepID=UPI000D525FF5|nr:hypothetical protein [Streptomyces nigra]AWE51214.1 hypothetical protein DC008_16900 [Streptomyces nigra]
MDLHEVMEKAHWVVIGVEWARWAIRGWRYGTANTKPCEKCFKELPTDPATDFNEQGPRLRVHEASVTHYQIGDIRVSVVVVVVIDEDR